MLEPYGYTIFCDDIREEVGAKFSYMGRYAGELLISGAEKSVSLPKFAAAIELVVPRDYEFKQARFVLSFEAGDQPASTLADMSIEPTGPQPPGDVVRVAANIILAPLHVVDGAFIRARGYLDDREVKAGSLKVRFTRREATASQIDGEQQD